MTRNTTAQICGWRQPISSSENVICAPPKRGVDRPLRCFRVRSRENLVASRCLSDVVRGPGTKSGVEIRSGERAWVPGRGMGILPMNMGWLAVAPHRGAMAPLRT
jgi:hypothetical protein